VLTNLLGNAVKFTGPEGTVSVHAERRGAELVLTVADTGMGIPDDEQQALFTRFFRATNAVHQAVPGAGLGAGDRAHDRRPARRLDRDRLDRERRHHRDRTVAGGLKPAARRAGPSAAA